MNNKRTSIYIDGFNLYYGCLKKSPYKWLDHLHAVHVDGSDLRYVTSANALKVVMSGEYKGHILVEQHRYFVQGGSYDWFWLFTSRGKEVGPVGEEPTLG